MKFWSNHAVLRMTLLIVFFAAGIVLLIVGWRMTGKLSGLVLMLIGVMLLLTSLLLYNKPFETPKERKGRGD